MQVARQFQRQERLFSVQVASGGHIYQTTSRDLSMGGIALTDCPPLPTDEPVKLFTIIQEHLYDGHTLLLIQAMPVWQRGDAVGLRFIDMPPDVRHSLSAVTSPLDALRAAL